MSLAAAPLVARFPKISAEMTQAGMIRLLKPRWEAVQTITLDRLGIRRPRSGGQGRDGGDVLL